MRLFLILLVLALSVAAWFLLKPGQLHKGELVESFTLETVQRRPFHLEKHSGKALCIVFFSMDDEQSREFFHYSQFLTNQFSSNNNVRFVAISSGGNSDRLKLFMSQFQFGGDVLLDSDRSVTEKFRVSSLPAFFVTDQDWVVRYNETGWHRDYILDIGKQLKEALRTNGL